MIPNLSLLLFHLCIYPKPYRSALLVLNSTWVDSYWIYSFFVLLLELITVSVPGLLHLDEFSHSSFIFSADSIPLFEYPQFIYSFYLTFVSSFDYYGQCCCEYSGTYLSCARVSQEYGEVEMLSHRFLHTFKFTGCCTTVFPKWFYQSTFPPAVSEILHSSRSLSALRIVTLFANLVGM